jgi:uncharacterized protein (DUF983 family)
MQKGTKLYSIFKNKCPRCQDGNVFVGNNPYNLRNFATMHRSCPVCGMSYRQEPGFYFGATYASYAMQAAIVVIFYFIFYIWLGFDVWPFVITVAGTLVALLPLTFRISRLLWLTMFGDKVGKKKEPGTN